LLAHSGQRADAAVLLHQALQLQPKNAALYLRQGEFFEGSGAMSTAAATYEAARRILPADHPEQYELAFRLALLYAGALARPEMARQALQQLPTGSPQAFAVLGLLACSQGDGRAALQHLNTALQQPLTNDLAGRLLFHAALAYRLLGDETNTYGSLYRAAGLASNLGLLYAMEQFMKEPATRR
jgi:tetratricopeptide (TPR) repeat protein